MNTCVNTNAQAGDTITVTAGSASWGTNGFTISQQASDLKILCATEGSCSVTGAGFYIYKTHNIRISGFVFTCTASSDVPPNACLSFEGANNFRFDHNTINNADWSTPLACFWAIGSLDTPNSDQESYGVLDHNTVSACRILVWGEWGDTGGKQRWFEHGDVRGTQFNVFVEDNVYTVPIDTPGPGGLVCNETGRVLCNFIDANHGGAIVARFNTIHNSYFEHHSVDSWAARGTKNFEVYHNTLDLAAPFTPNFSRPFSLQGSGSGVIFENHSSSNFSVPNLSFNYINRAPTSGEGTDKCTGFNESDGNKNGFGYPCLDQFGVSHDLALMSTSSSVGQAKTPWYTWHNDQPNGNWLWVNGGGTDVADIVVENRDFYQKQASFNGTVGMGVGTLAARPATCTTGVGYWATDQGEWNSNQAGNDGQLYKCTSTDTWSFEYKPYTYPHPHPLQN